MTASLRGARGLVTAVALACSGAPTRTTHVMVSERALACETIAGELASLDLETAAEAELVRMMEAADANADTCAAGWVDDAHSPGEQHIARHRGRQLTLYALQIELALSRRFDREASLCVILADTFRELLGAVGEIEEGLTTAALSDSERARLLELRDLDLEAVDVLVVANQEQCE